MADLYGTNTTSSNNAVTQGAGSRPSPKNEALRLFRDSYTLATATWANADVLYFGPFRAGEALHPADTKICGDGTVDLGDDVDVGWAYQDGTSSDDDAFATAANMSAANIDVDGLAVNTSRQAALLEPPTNDRPWYLTLSPDDVTDAAAGDMVLEALVLHDN